MKIFYTDGTNQFGPFSAEELKTKGLTRETKVWHFGLAEWTPIAQLDELKDIVQIILPPPLPKKEIPLEREKEIVPTIPPPLKLKTPEIPAPPPFPRKEILVKQEPIEQEKVSEETINATEVEENWGQYLKRNVFNQSIIQGAVWVLAIGFVVWLVLPQNRENKDDKRYNKIVARAYSGDEDFNFYIDKFYRDIKLYNLFPQRPDTLIVKFSDLSKIAETTHIHGISFGQGNDKKIEIYINPDSWRTFKRGGKYWLIYHELAHDVLNVDDLPETSANEGKLMYPKMGDYEPQSMDEFIEASHQLFEEVAKKKK